MRLIDFLRDYGEALEDAKEQRQKQAQQHRCGMPKAYSPHRHR